jgi:hypothetical protein
MKAVAIRTSNLLQSPDTSRIYSRPLLFPEDT